MFHNNYFNISAVMSLRQLPRALQLNIRILPPKRLFTSTQVACKKLTHNINDPEKIKHVFVEKKVDKKPVENDPFVKGLFKGQFDKVGGFSVHLCLNQLDV